jgi:hypothetical protein
LEGEKFLADPNLGFPMKNKPEILGRNLGKSLT